MKDQRHHVLAEKAAEHHGVFTRRDALDAGLPDTTIYNGVTRGRYKQLLPGVFAVAGSPDSIQQRMVAVVLSMPELAAVSHRAAAEMWGLTSRGVHRIDVVTTRWDRVRRSDIDVHESLDLLAEDVTAINGIPVTSPARTIVDLGAVQPWAVERALDRGARDRRFTYKEVDEMVARVARKGRRGVGVIRPLLEARNRWMVGTESALEDRFRKVLADAGIPQPHPQYVLRDEADNFVCRADFAYPEHRLLIELDGMAHHTDQGAFRRDRSKQNQALLLGWTVLRYTWWDLEGDAFRVCTQLTSALAARHLG